MSKKNEGFFESFFAYENMRSLAILIVIIFAFRWSVMSFYHVPTASMEPTIKVGDRLLALKLAYNLKIPFTDIEVASWASPKRGDIIVFKYPKQPDTDYVKRVVGVAGDKIKVRDDIIYINGQAQSRVNSDSDRSILDDIEDHKEYKILFRENLSGAEHWVIQNQTSQRHFTGKNWPPGAEEYTVPDQSVFVMGDNRDNSQDSRIWGEVPLSYVRGKALFVTWSVFSPPEANFPTLRWNRFGYGLH